MRRVRASAPGKVVLIGEYAVLHGAPALVMAVNRRARVSVESCRPEQSRVESPQLETTQLPFTVTGDRAIDWLSPRAGTPEFAFCREVLEACLRQHSGELPEPGGMAVRIDTSALYRAGSDKPVKLGLGSSAAVTVALSAAIRAFLTGASSRCGIGDLLAFHRLGQGGQGSGIDLAASLAGGVNAYRLDPEGPRLDGLSWPRDWPLLFVWTGKPASTGRFLGRYAAWRRDHPDVAGALFEQMTDCARSAQRAVRSADLEGCMTCVNDYRILMGKIGALMNVPVVSAEHADLASTAAEVGVAYKPCGAGGGDLGMLLAADAGQLAAARARIEAEGYEVVDLSPDAAGLELAIDES